MALMIARFCSGGLPRFDRQQILQDAPFRFSEIATAQACLQKAALNQSAGNPVSPGLALRTVRGCCILYRMSKAMAKHDRMELRKAIGDGVILPPEGRSYFGGPDYLIAQACFACENSWKRTGDTGMSVRNAEAISR